MQITRSFEHLLSNNVIRKVSSEAEEFDFVVLITP